MFVCLFAPGGIQTFIKYINNLLRAPVMADKEHKERRYSEDRRMDVVDRRLGLDRRRGPGRRLSNSRKAAEEGHMSDEQFEFLLAIDEYKKSNSRPFPTWTEVLEVIKALGYRKVADPQSLDEPIEEEEEIRVPLGTWED
jgi:hypothetical protein